MALSPPPDFTRTALAIRSGLDLQRHDPLRYRRISSPQVRTLIEHVVAGIEGYGHAGNGAAKTEEFAALFVRMCRGQKVMDGRLLTRAGDPVDPADLVPHPIALPGFYDNEPWRHWVLIQSYSQAKDSSMRAYRKVLGRWPHELGWVNKALGHVKLIKVKPELDGWSDDPETWSETTFISQENMTDEDVRHVQGARVHSVHCDEMPLMAVLREIRARRIANRMLIKVTTATPEYKPEWEEMFEDFRVCKDVPVRGRVRIQWSVDDNRALSLEDIALRKRDYLNGDGSPSDLYDARVAGEHCDVSGACPFPHKPMDRLLAQCQNGRLEKIILRAPVADPAAPDFRDILPASAVIERWLPFDPTHSYVITNDTSRGIDDGAHDPCELEVWDWHEPALVCRFGMRKGDGGYLDEDSLALLANHLGLQYGNALIDVEVAGQWGQQFILTLRKLRYPNIAHDDVTASPGTIVKRYGWTASPTTNGEIVNALIKGLSEGTFQCWSRDVVNQWKDVREDSQGRPANVARNARHHREAMICAGRALHWIQTRPAPKVIQSRVEDAFTLALKKDFGRDIRKTTHRQKERRELFRGNAP